MTPQTEQTWTIQQILQWTTDSFTKCGFPTPRLDAEVLLAWCLNLKRIDLYLKFDQPLSMEERTRFREIVKRRQKGEPVSYIRQIKEFWSLPFKVGPGVLIPRPDTEILIETLLKQIEDKENYQANILDIGTGSGALSIALATELPNVRITALDNSDNALNFAKGNAINHKVEDHIHFVHHDFLSDNLPASEPAKTFNLIISNPPYIRTSEIEQLDAGIKDFEPYQALDGGEDGLAFYRKIGDCLSSLLTPKGSVLVEIGHDQAQTVCQIFSNAGLQDIQIVKDYAGLDRVILAQ